MIQALMTALLSGLFSGFIMFGLNEERDRLNERAKKIEEAFLAYAEWIEAIIALYSRQFSFVTKLPSDFDSETKRLSRNLDIARNKARGLLHFYVDGAEELESAISKHHLGVLHMWHEMLNKNIYLDPEKDGYLERRAEIAEMARALGPLLTDLVDEQRDGMHEIARQGKALVDRPYLLQSIRNRFKRRAIPRV